MRKEEDYSQYLQNVEEIERKDIEWLIPNWIPKGGITLLVGDGGIGKTNLWTCLISDLSRNFLGVHTPQDVLAGVVAGTLVMHLTMKLMQWVKLHPEKDSSALIIRARTGKQECSFLRAIIWYACIFPKKTLLPSALKIISHIMRPTPSISIQ